MVGKTKAANKSERDRMSAIKDLPCLPCMLVLYKQVFRKAKQSTVQHVVEGFRRLGHEYTYGSCAYHHLGHNDEGMSNQKMMGIFGPSLAHGKRTFQGTFGSERNLVKVQNLLLKRWEESSWGSYMPPRNVLLEVVNKWIDGK